MFYAVLYNACMSYYNVHSSLRMSTSNYFVSRGIERATHSFITISRQGATLRNYQTYYQVTTGNQPIKHGFRSTDASEYSAGCIVQSTKTQPFLQVLPQSYNIFGGLCSAVYEGATIPQNPSTIVQYIRRVVQYSARMLNHSSKFCHNPTIIVSQLNGRLGRTSTSNSSFVVTDFQH